MKFEIQKPQEGSITITMNWNEAEILTRLVGMANSGNLDSIAPTLAQLVEHMVGLVGRNHASEARKYLATIQSGQVYIGEVE